MAGGSDIVRYPRGLEKRLAGHAAGPGAVASDAMPLDESDPRSEADGNIRGNEPA
jgi:hypothetical protein